MAELRVLSVREIELTGRAAQQWGARAYESEILLITGRTHQVSSMRLTLLEHMLCGAGGSSLKRQSRAVVMHTAVAECLCRFAPSCHMWAARCWAMSSTPPCINGGKRLLHQRRGSSSRGSQRRQLT